MCKWGTHRLLRVPIPAELSYTGAARWTEKPIDACLADLIEALNLTGILTASSCCGHGSDIGHIILQDGRTLIVTPAMPKCETADESTIDRLRRLAYDAVAKGEYDIATSISLLTGLLIDGKEAQAIKALRVDDFSERTWRKSSGST